MLVKNDFLKKFKPKAKINIGLNILRVLLSLDVIVSHCFKQQSTKNEILLFILKRRKVHVPSFYMMSFYFNYKNFISYNFKKYKNRIERLLIPYIGWPIIFWIFNIIINKIFKSNFVSSLKDLINQILWGQIFIGQLWFQWDLIIFTIFFIIILFIIKKNYLFILQLFTLISYFLQYSGYNKKFYHYLSIEKRESLGRLAEVLPFAVTGFTYAYFNIFEIFKDFKIKTVILSVSIFIFLEKYNIFSDTTALRISYAGIILNVRATCLVFIFSLIPFENITKKFIINALLQISKFTAGVFYLHISVFIYLKKIVNPIKQGSFFGCLIIYFICYLICLVGIKFFGNTRFKNLFI